MSQRGKSFNTSVENEDNAGRDYNFRNTLVTNLASMSIESTMHARDDSCTIAHDIKDRESSKIGRHKPYTSSPNKGSIPEPIIQYL